MSKGQPRPKVGETAWIKGELIMITDDKGVLPFQVRAPSGAEAWLRAEDIAHIGDTLPSAAPRQPWEVLREAAQILEDRFDWRAVARDIRKVADTVEREALPPDPLDLLRRIVAHTESFHGAPRTGTGQQLYEEARRCLAAHDKGAV